MRAQFVISEVVIGLRRNLTMTAAVIVTVAISLALFGCGLLIHEQVDKMKGYWYDRIEVSLFLEKDVSQAQREALRQELETHPEIDRVYYESQEEAYQRFQESFSNFPALVENTDPTALPESFRIKLKDPKNFDVIASQFAARPGVDNIFNLRQHLGRFFKVLNAFEIAAIFIAALQLVAAGFLISNTIRVAAFSRRRETGIMRLVGASNLYIQLPFLLEGALAGLIGVALATGILALIKRFFVDSQLRPAFQAIAFIGWDAVLGVIPWLLLFGVGLSAISSYVTLRKHLRV